MRHKLTLAATVLLSSTSLSFAAFPAAVNKQITDAVTRANTKVLGTAPAMALGNLYQATSQALGNAARNATAAQQNANNTTRQAVITQGVALLYAIDTSAPGKVAAKILGCGCNQGTQGLAAALKKKP